LYGRIVYVSVNILLHYANSIYIHLTKQV